MAHARSLGDPAAQTRANATLMKLSRILLPVTYTKGGRYTHDPAEWSSIMRNTKSSLFPGLNPGLALPDLEGTDAYGFVKAGVVRHLNRTVDAFHEAARACHETISETPTAAA
ncbi:MAG: hypothetical protein ACNA7W_16750 [Pseudomonadales bacterium]